MATKARRFNSYDALKLVALAAMTVDHVGFYLLPEWQWLRVIGRLAAPAFLFLVGYNGSYAFRWPLLVGACAVTLGDGLLHDLWYPQNILWTILLGRMALQWIERRQAAPLIVLAACLIWFLPTAVVIECGTLGLVWMLFGRAIRREGHSRSSMVYGAVGLVGATAQTLFVYEWSLAQDAALVLVNSLLWVAFWRFRVKDIGGGTAPLRLLSKHSLLYYVVHRLLLQGASLL